MISKILGWLSGILAIIGGVLYGLLQRAKIKELKRDVETTKASEKAGDKATEALVRGINEESKPVKRGHFTK